MKILSIETSCDDTGVAILGIKGLKKPSFKVLANIVSSQEIHKNYGGVFPAMAKREHQNNLLPVLEKTLKESKLLNPKHKAQSPKQIQNPKLKTIEKILEKESKLYQFTKEFLEKYEKPDIDAIAVTYGPGLEPCLWVGVNFARALSYYWNIPIIPVNHIEGHILVNFLEAKSYKLKAKEIFPAISLVVSGGHTQLILVKGIGKYEIIGETRDDAAGECFDKAARILNLGYPGGPIISNIASKIKESNITLPRPMIHTKDYDFSFSGLKTAVLYKLRDTKPETAKSEKFIQEMCFAVQDAICDVLVRKTINAARDYKAKTIILGGGVSANKELRKQFDYKLKAISYKLNLLVPPANLSTDNGLMIAVAGYFNRAKKIAWQKLSANANLRL